jgi:hypothetical protein
MWLFGSALVGAGILAGLGLLHIYWACGGRFGKGSVVPERNGIPLFRPSRGTTLLVAVLLWAGSACLLARLGLLGGSLPPGIISGGVWFMAVAFLLRSIGDFRYVGFFKRGAQSRFAYWDTRVYSPVCLLLFFACVSAALCPLPRS